MQASRRGCSSSGQRAAAWRTPRPQQQRRQDGRVACSATGRAVVIGGGIAGLAAAQSLSQHFGRVLVLERDAPVPPHPSAVEVAKDKTARRGVTQFNHLHGMASRGLLTLDRLFDGRFILELRQAGATIVNMLDGFSYAHPASGRWASVPRDALRHGPIWGALATRHVHEGAVRRLVAGNGRVELRHGASVAGLALEGAPGSADAAVTGVLLADGSQVAADLVVDASGRRSAMPQWLAAAGYLQREQLQVDELRAQLSYASWYVRLAPEAEAQLASMQAEHGCYTVAAAPHTVGAALTRLEGGMWCACIGCYAGHTPPFNDAQLLPFLREAAWDPTVCSLLAGAEQLAPASRFYGLGSVWRRYDRVTLPQRLIIMADALASPNPIYGHGMSVAAVQAVTLGELLHARRARAGGADARWLHGLSREFQAAVQPMLQEVWDLCTAGDRAFPTTTSSQPLGPLDALLTAAKGSYMLAVFQLAARDPLVSEVLLRVMHLLDSSNALLRPEIAGRVLLHALGAPFRARRAPAAPPITQGAASAASAAMQRGR